MTPTDTEAEDEVEVPDDRAPYARSYDPSTPPDDLPHTRQAEEPDPDAVPDGTVPQVQAWIGTDKDRAQAALAVEQSDGGKGRVTVIEFAEAVMDLADEAPADGDPVAPEGDSDATDGTTEPPAT